MNRLLWGIKKLYYRKSKNYYLVDNRKPVTINLPVKKPGQVFTIKKISDNSHPITIKPTKNKVDK